MNQLTNNRQKECPSTIRMAINEGPNFFARATPSNCNISEPHNFHANKFSPLDIFDNETESCKKYSCMVRTKNNMSDDVGHMPKKYYDASSIKMDTTFETSNYDNIGNYKRYLKFKVCIHCRYHRTAHIST